MRDELSLKGLSVFFHGFLALAGLASAGLSALAAAAYAPVAGRRGLLGSAVFFALLGVSMAAAAGYEARRALRLLEEDDRVSEAGVNFLGLAVAAFITLGAAATFGVAFFIWKTSP